MRYVTYTLNQLNSITEESFLSTLFWHTENRALNLATDADKDKIDSWKDCLSFLKGFISKIDLLALGNITICFEYEIFDGTWVDAVIVCDNKLIILEFKSGSDCRQSTLDGHRIQIIGYFNKITRCNKVIWQEMKRNPKFQVEKYLVYTNSLMKGKTESLDYIKVGEEFQDVIGQLTTAASEERVASLLEFEEELDITTTGVMRDILNQRLLSQMYVQDDNVAACARVVEQIKNDKKDSTLNLIFIKGAPGAGKTGTGFSLLEKYMNQGAKYVTGNGNLSQIFSQMIRADRIQGTEAAIVGSLHNLYDVASFCRKYQDQENVSLDTCPNSLLIIDEAQRIWNPIQIAIAKKNKLTSKQKAFIIENEVSEAMLVLRAVMQAILKDKQSRTVVLLMGSGQEIYIGEEDGEKYIKKAIQHIKIQSEKMSKPIPIHLYLPTENMKLEYQTLGVECTLVPGLLLEENKRNEYNKNALTFVNTLIDSGIPKGECSKDAFMVYKDYSKLRRVVDSFHTDAFSVGVVGCGFDTLTEWVENPYGKKEPHHYLSLNKEKIYNIRNQELMSFFVEKGSNTLKKFASQFNCQGLELDYVIMIWGSMMVWRRDHWELSKRQIWAVEDYCKKLDELKRDYPSLQDIFVDKEIHRTFIKNSYRVLLTRARIATFIYCEDVETKDYLESCIQGANLLE